MYRYKNIVFRIFTFLTCPQLFGLVNVYPHYLTVYVCMYACMYVCMWICVCVYIMYIYIYGYTLWLVVPPETTNRINHVWGIPSCS